MKTAIYPVVLALFVSLAVGVVWSEEGDPQAAEREALQQEALRLIEQGAVDYERLKQALAATEAKKAEVAAAGGSLQTMDQLAKRAELLNADITELQRARGRLEEARARLRSGRFDAARTAFDDAVARWSAVHQRIVSHVGEAAPADRPVRPAPSGELQALREEVRALRQEVQALRAEVNELRAIVKAQGR